jgi:hypothetical protein
MLIVIKTWEGSELVIAQFVIRGTRQHTKPVRQIMDFGRRRKDQPAKPTKRRVLIRFWTENEF